MSHLHEKRNLKLRRADFERVAQMGGGVANLTSQRSLTDARRGISDHLTENQR